MSADFWAGYISGAVGILIGNPLDLIKVRLQAQAPCHPLSAEPTLSRQASHSSLSLRPTSISAASSSLTQYFQTKSSLVTGTAAPVLGYGALNALLFVAYNRTEDALNHALSSPSFSSTTDVTSNADEGSKAGSNLWTTWLAGAVGGLATWFISTPTELIKCRAQLATPSPTLSSSSLSSASSSSNSYRIAQSILRTEGVRGFYHGGVVTALRDSIGYGFYFWAYELGGQIMTSLLARRASSVHSGGMESSNTSPTAFSTQETLKVLLCGGLAGVVTWASIFPLDVIKTRVQGQARSNLILDPAATPLLGTQTRKGAVQAAREAYCEGGTRVFFRGLMVCSVRAFIVNAVQWAVYEWIMLELGQRNHDRRKESHS